MAISGVNCLICLVRHVTMPPSNVAEGSRKDVIIGVRFHGLRGGWVAASRCGVHRTLRLIAPDGYLLLRVQHTVVLHTHPCLTDHGNAPHDAIPDPCKAPSDEGRALQRWMPAASLSTVHLPRPSPEMVCCHVTQARLHRRWIALDPSVAVPSLLRTSSALAGPPRVEGERPASRRSGSHRAKEQGDALRLNVECHADPA